MSIIEKLKQDHDELGRIADELERHIAGDAPSDPAALASCRWRLARLMLQHIALEDRQIYSRRLDPRSALGIAAARLKEELAALYALLQQHVTTWTAQAVIADWTAYRAETGRLLKLLRERTEREERELYPLVEQAAARQASKAA